MPGDDYDPYYEECDCGDDDCPECGRACHTCHGECVVIIGEDVPARDIDLGSEGETRPCPNCNGSGMARDCSYW